MGMVKAVLISRADDHINAKVAENVLAFCQILHVKSPVAYKLMKNNLFGISVRHIQCIQANKARDSCVLDQESIKDRVGKWTKGLSEKIGRKPLVHLAVDVTKMPKEEVSSAFGVMVGRASPNHLMGIVETREPLQKHQLADETKVAILTTQDVVLGISVVKMVSARPQSTNQKCDEYNKLLVDTVQDDEECILASICFDGLVSAESDFIRDGLLDFILALINVVHGTDMNHLGKSLRSAVVLGTHVLTAGHALIDTGLLLMTDINKELVQITDYTSDGLVTELCSAKTLQSMLTQLQGEEGDHVAALDLTLYFIHIALLAVNSKENIPASERI